MIPEWNKVNIESIDFSEIMDGYVNVRLIEEGNCWYEQRSILTLNVDDVFTDGEHLPDELGDFENAISDYVYESGLMYEGERTGDIQYGGYEPDEVHVNQVNLYNHRGTQVSVMGYRNIVSI